MLLAEKNSELSFSQARLIRAGVILSAFVSLAGAETASGVAASRSLTAELPLTNDETQPHLKTIKELAGFGLEVTAKQRQQLKNSTIKLDAINKSNLSIHSSCTGLKIIANSLPYIITAGHCFRYLDPSIEGWINSRSPQTEALDFLNPTTNNYRFRIHDPTGSTYATIAEVQGISIPEGRDYALLSIDPNSIVKPPPDANKAGPVPRYFDQIPRLAYKAAFAEPLAGQEAAVYSVPDANNDLAVAETGIYLGRTSPNLKKYIKLPPNELFDVVAIKTSAPKNDGCQYGSSGSAAILADGHILGPLSERFNLGYGPRHKIYPPDSSLIFQKHFWRNIENDLGVRIDDPSFRTLCFYNVPSRETIPVMLTGFGHYSP